MVNVESEHTRSSSPIPLLQQAQQEQVAQDIAHMGSEYLQRRKKVHNVSGLPAPVLDYPSGKKVYCSVQMGCNVFQFVPVATFITEHHWEQPG